MADQDAPINVPVIPANATTHQLSSAFRHILHPTAVSVDSELPRDLVSLSVACGTVEGTHTYVLPLSPPTAMQLSRALKRAVKAYLRGDAPPETE